MPHDIFGERFVSYRQPAWHGLGQIVQEPITAADGLGLMGEVKVTTETLVIPGMDGLTLPYKVIVRHPTHDDPQFLPLGVVSTDYELINPSQFADLWDKYVGKPIETIGFLRAGGLIFITTKLPSFDVKGDEVEDYLIAINGMTGSNCGEMRRAPVRVVCANTLALSGELATEVIRVVHDAGVLDRFGTWLSDMYHKAERQAGVIKSTFEVLANTSPTAKQLKTTLELAYPTPKPPRRNAPDSVMEKREEYHQFMVNGMALRRSAAQALFEGDGVGMDLPAARGTFWGLYNAVVETEDYRRGGYSEENVAFERLFGDRALTKERALDVCVAYSTGNDPLKLKLPKMAPSLKVK